MDASIISCALKFTDQAKIASKGQNIMRYTKAMVHEMVPITNSTVYCIYVNEFRATYLFRLKDNSHIIWTFQQHQ